MSFDTKKLYKTHYQGAIVRSIASICMWLFVLASYLLNILTMVQFTGTSIAVIYLILINPPTLWLLRHTRSKRWYATSSLFINQLEIIGYTAIIYFIGSIRTPFMAILYAGPILYVGVVGRKTVPLKLAGLSAITFFIMVLMEEFGIIPHQYFGIHSDYPFAYQFAIVVFISALLFVMAILSSYTASLLKKIRQELQVAHNTLEQRVKERTSELVKANKKLKKTDNTIKRQKEELETVNQELLMANKELHLSEQKFSKAFNLGPLIITISKISDGTYVEASEYFLKTTEYTREEVIGRTSIELKIWKNEEDIERVVKTVMETGEVHEWPIWFQSKNKKEYLMLLSAEIVTIEDKAHFVSVAVDITERQKAKEERDQMEKQMHQAQKMESIGRLAGGVAHDFNNLLTAIIGSTQMLMASELGEKKHSRLEVILKAADSAADLTRQLLAFSRKQIIEPRLMDLNINVRHMTKMLTRMIGENIRLSTRIDVPKAPIMADPSQVEQIIVNLAVNARDAMPDGGALILQITEVMLDASYCKSRPYVLPGVYMALTVSDTGMGIRNEDIKKIFEPFYTTKPPGEGTGLGLATVYGAVKQNNGSIEVYSVPEKGTSFKIYFPKVSIHGEPLPAEDMQDLAAVGFETILLVEDDTLVRELAVESLKLFGYIVIETSNAEDALKIAKDYDEDIHLLFTDIILPGMNGKALADALVIIRPDTPVLFTSGYTGDMIDHHGILNKGIAFIEKPYTIYALSQKIRKTLSSIQK